MPGVEKVHLRAVYGIAANFDLDLRDEFAVSHRLEGRLHAICLRLWAIDFAGTGAVWEVVDVVAGLLVRIPVILVTLRVWWKFNRNPVVPVAHRIHTALECRHRIGRGEDDRVVVVYWRKRLLNDDGHRTLWF